MSCSKTQITKLQLLLIETPDCFLTEFSVCNNDFLLKITHGNISSEQTSVVWCNYYFYLQNSFQGALKVSAQLAGPAQTPPGSFVFGECDSSVPNVVQIAQYKVE